MRRTFKVLFYIKRKNPRKDGAVCIMCRITINGEAANFSTRLFIDPETWDTATSRVRGRKKGAAETNDEIDKLRFKVETAYRRMLETDNYVSAHKLKRVCMGLDHSNETLLSLFESHNREFSRQVDNGRSRSTYNKYNTVYLHLRDFVRTRFRKDDIPFRELDSSFIREFDLFLRIDKKCKTNTVWVYMMPLRRMVALARSRGYLSSDPFADHRVSPENVNRQYLSLSELELMMRSKLPEGMEFMRDLFVFSCFTGLSYSDVRNLTRDNLHTSFDGHTWIHTNRQKTNASLHIRLLEIPRKIIEKYSGGGDGGRLFAVPSNPQCNRVLRRIAEHLAIKKDITFHIARHTFATTVTLSNGVPIETVSRLLGHSNIKTTQIYAHITNKKLSMDMQLLSDKLRPMEDMICSSLASVY